MQERPAPVREPTRRDSTSSKVCNGGPRVSTTAILVIENPVSATTNSQEFCGGVSELLMTPLACQEIIGQSVLERMIGRLQNAGIRDISVITDGHPAGPLSSMLRKDRKVEVVESRADRWFAKHSKQQSWAGETILVLKLGGYVEFNAADLLRLHQENHHNVTRAHHNAGPLDIWAVSIPTDGQPELNLSWLTHSARSTAYPVPGYVRQLHRHCDLRQLAVDMLLGRCAAKPEGREIRPGVWIASGARVHSRARIVAPAYVGGETTVGAYAVITRCSNLERCCDIGSGTHIAGSSICSGTRVGRGLFVSESIVDGGGLLHLRKNALVKVTDGRLLGRTIPSREVGLSTQQGNTPPLRAVQMKPQPRPVVAESCPMGLLEDEG